MFIKVASIFFFFNQKETEYSLNFFLSIVINGVWFQDYIQMSSASNINNLCQKRKKKSI